MTTQGQGRQWHDVREACLDILTELVRMGKLEEWSKEEDAWMDLAQDKLEEVAKEIVKP